MMNHNNDSSRHNGIGNIDIINIHNNHDHDNNNKKPSDVVVAAEALLLSKTSKPIIRVSSNNSNDSHSNNNHHHETTRLLSSSIVSRQTKKRISFHNSDSFFDNSHHGTINSWKPSEIDEDDIELENDIEKNDARDVLQARPCSGVLSKNHHMTINDKELIKRAKIVGIIFPYTTFYKTFWWNITAISAIITAFLLPYQIAFEPIRTNIMIHSHSYDKSILYFFFPFIYHDYYSIADWIELILYIIFCIDIIINLHLATYKNEILLYHHKDIINEYIFGTKMFFIDIIGIFPFQTIALYIFQQTLLLQNNQDQQITNNIMNNNVIDETLISSTTLSDNMIRINQTALLLSLLRLFELVRLHRIPKLSEILQYNARVSLLSFTLIRNLSAVLSCVHWEACSMYYIARYNNFDETTWLGPLIADKQKFDTGFIPYVASLYWSIVTFCTVGYGDFSCKSATEQIIGSIFMLMNIVVAAWIIGSITLLIVKGDEKTGEYRSSLETLYQYGKMHSLDNTFIHTLKRQLRLIYDNREISDEQVLKHYPSAVRRKILRKLYYNQLAGTHLMKDISQQSFIDAFLSSCTVEIFSPGEEIIEKGSILSDLFLLIGGIAEVTIQYDNNNSNNNNDGNDEENDNDTMTNNNDRFVNIYDHSRHNGANSVSGNTTTTTTVRIEKLYEGDFIGEIGFFTESIQPYSVSSITVCKTLTMSKSSYQLLIQDYPMCASQILNNLLEKVKYMSSYTSSSSSSFDYTNNRNNNNNNNNNVPQTLTVLGSFDDVDGGDNPINTTTNTTTSNTNHSSNINYGSTARLRYSLYQMNDDDTTAFLNKRAESLNAIEELVKMYMNKQLDDQTTQLLYASSRGDNNVISRMCNNGFHMNNTDYDHRTALMVASMKGNTDIVKLLLDYKADPNMIDMHGSSALYEAVRNGHEDTMKLLLEYNATLCMSESRAASVLCQAVSDGDIILLRRLLDAGIDVNATDYDKRTASHIASAEGNVMAIKTLAKYGADFNLQDRWNNTIFDEAKRSNTTKLLIFLDELREKQKQQEQK